MVMPSWGNFESPQSNKIENFPKETPQEEISDELRAEGEKPEWSNFQSPETFQGDEDPNAEEGWFEYFKRNAFANAARFAEQVGGSFGNTQKFATDILVNLPKQTGEIGQAIYDLIGEDRWEKLIRGKPGYNLPTSEDLRGMTKDITGEYTDPRTPGEEKLQSLSGDIGTTVNPAGRFSAARNIAIPVAANIASNIVEETGFGKDAASKTKLAVWLPFSMANAINAPRYASDLMNNGRRGIPNTVQMDVQRFTNSLNHVDSNLLTSDPRTLLARQSIAALRNDIASGQTNAHSLMTMYDAVNAAKRNRGMFELGRADRNFARRSIDQVRDAVRDELRLTGQNHPQALNQWENGVRAWAVIHQSRALTNRAEELARGPYAKILTGPAAALFGIGGYGAAKVPIVAMTGSTLLPAGYKTGQTLFRMYQDPNLRRYYFNALNGLSQENIPVFIKNYNELNKKLESTEPKGKSKKND